ncbi:MAG: CRISPR-associated endonuclease Cas1 [Pseudomonadota bacterium]
MALNAALEDYAMSVLYLTEDGSVLRKRGERLVVEKDDKELLEVELRRITAVIMLDSVQVTTQALAQMLSFGVEFAIVSHWGRLLGQLTPPLARNIPLRKAQFSKETDREFALAQAKEVVAAKLHNSMQVLTRYMWDESGAHPSIGQSLTTLEKLLAGVPAAEGHPQLLGLEGSGAAAYWSSFAGMLKPADLNFTGRKKHPPPDPVNAVLSFGYVLLTNELQSLLDGMGFDPFLGFLHEEEYGRPSLALDLVEPFRAPVVDRFVVRLFNLKILKPDSFEQEQDKGFRMTKPAMRSFFKHWEAHLAKMDVRPELRRQAEQLAKVFTDQEPLVKPWRWSAR